MARNRELSGKLSSPAQVVRYIVNGLYEGAYAPGQRLVESDLTRRYSIGRGSVREALSRLVAEGVATFIPNRGACIRVLDRRYVINILEVLEVLEGLMARNAAQNIQSPEERSRLSTSLNNVEKAHRDGGFSELARARNSLYGTLAEIAKNAEVARVVPRVQVHLIRVQFRSHLAPADSKIVEDYRKVVQAILAKDPLRAEKAMRVRIRRTTAVIAELPDRAFIS